MKRPARIAALLAATGTLAAAAPAGAATFTVTSDADTGAGSLAEAIDAANANNNEADTTDLIVFNIAADPPGGGPHVIFIPATYTISEPVTIDGSTDPTGISIDGSTNTIFLTNNDAGDLDGSTFSDLGLVD